RLLKFSAATGARAVREILADHAPAPAKPQAESTETHDLVIVGAGIAGMSAALEARKANLNFVILEGSEPFSTIVNFPKAKPIYTYPHDMKPAGELQFREEVHPKEILVEDIQRQTASIKPVPARAERIARKGESLEV